MRSPALAIITREGYVKSPITWNRDPVSDVSCDIPHQWQLQLRASRSTIAPLQRVQNAAIIGLSAMPLFYAVHLVCPAFIPVQRWRWPVPIWRSSQFTVIIAVNVRPNLQRLSHDIATDKKLSVLTVLTWSVQSASRAVFRILKSPPPIQFECCSSLKSILLIVKLI